MNLDKWGLLLLILLLTDLKLTECRRGSFGRGGSFSRGSASRSGFNNAGGSSDIGSNSHGGTYLHSGGGLSRVFSPLNINTGGAHVGGEGSGFNNQGSAGKGGFNNAGSGIASNSRGGTNIGGGVSSFSKGSDVGSMLRSNTFKAAIAGAAAGHLTYQAGKAIINEDGDAINWNNRQYYWDPQYYQRQSDYEMCFMPLTNSPDKTFDNVFFSNGTRPKQIVWSCRAYTERCCGYECCPNAVPGGSSGGSIVSIIFIVFIVFLFFLCCGCSILNKFFHKTLHCILPSKNDENTGVKLDEYPMNYQAPAYKQAPTQGYPKDPQQQQPFVQQQTSNPQQQPYQQQPYPSQPYPSQPYPTQPC